MEHLLIKSPAEMSALTLGAFKIQKYYSNWNYLMEYKVYSQYIFDEIIQIDYLKILLIITCDRKLKSAGVLFERYLDFIGSHKVGKCSWRNREVGKF